MNKTDSKLTKFFECVLWFFFFYGFIHVTISVTQTIKDIYYYMAATAIVFIALLVRRTLKMSWWIAVSIVLYVGYVVYFLYYHRNDWGYQYAIELSLRFLMYGLFALLVLDLIGNGNKVFLLEKKINFACIALIMAGIILAFDTYFASMVLVPILAWYSIPMSRSDWEKRFVSMGFGAYATFVAVMTWSLITCPNGFEEEGRYIGRLYFPVAGGLLCLYGLIGGFLIWKYFFSNKRKKSRKCLLLVLILIYPFIMMVLCFNRAVILGMMSAGAFAFVFCAKKKGTRFKRGIFIVVAGTVITLLICVGIIVLLKKGVTAEDLDSNSYLSHAIAKTFSEGSRTGAFRPRSLFNSLDYFSSGRLGLWRVGIQQAKLFGPTELNIALPSGVVYGHVHNTYIDWALRLGWTGAVVVIAWFVWYIIRSIKMYIEGRREVLYTMLWATFALAFILVERELWQNLPLFMLLMLQYPLLFKFTDEKNADDERQAA